MDEMISLFDLSSKVSRAARIAGYALMRANYVERSMGDLTGMKVPGVPREAKALAVRLRDSIWIRYDSLRFHHDMMRAVHKQHDDRLQTVGPGEEEFWTLWGAVLRQQYLFDDVIFNSVSLFDYLGNAIWLGFHGQNHVKQGWNKVYSAARKPDFEPKGERAKKIYGSETGQKVIEAHRGFVNKLYDYRSDVIHHRLDTGTGKNLYRISDDQGAGALRVAIPEEFRRRLRNLVPESSPGGGDPDVVAGVEHVIRKVGFVTHDILTTLTEELEWDPSEGLAWFD